MKVAYCIRKNWKVAHGGDVVQMLNTKAEIEKAYDVNIKIIDNINELKVFKPDIVHIFNMQTIEESSEYLKEAKSLGAKTVLSTIYWDMSHARFIVNFAKLGFFCTGENYKTLYHLYKNTESVVASMFGKPTSATKKYKDEVRGFLQEFDWHLPNSEEEMQIVNHVFNTNYKNYSVIPNSVDFNKFPFFSNTQRKGFISAARIEPIKNQLQIVDICKESGFDLTLVGGVTPNNMNYLDAVKKKSSGVTNIQLIAQNVDQSELGALFNKHKVHILASFRESPGLSSLEALGSGMNVVVCESNYCPTDTYFNKLINKHVFVCDPYSKKSIKSAMEQALLLSTPKENLIKEFSWINTAKKTYESYLKMKV
ncbi:glycosyl transferase family 1 [Acinetobacter sp. TGL-Y2]|uniref:glycosyltransferase n=1 Tax=Acinetobacter sp. TGL-Y2 TaxID=1407071 RepID=UPI0007A657CB|nr:glycosyltransferase [Acinetobacter sp. TGL-Y2]AMW77518.1 glycosyl transferase family 1 [Acinetobacter sp. TGL-Y2]